MTKMTKMKYLISMSIIGIFVFSLTQFALAEKNQRQQPQSSSFVEHRNSTNVYWGDTHVHTNLSIDAYAGGNVALTPENAYQFASGRPVIAHNGSEVRLRRPLDFLVVADHAFNLGVIVRLRVSDKKLLNTEMGKSLYDNFSEYLTGSFAEKTFIDDVGNDGYKQSIWNDVVSVADRYNDPGKFTTFSGYEWTSLGRTNSVSLHRVVIFKDNANKVNKIRPFSMFDGTNPEDLWKFLENYEQKTGGEVIAIPHNANISNGAMFALVDMDNRPLTQEYAKTRSRWEPILEVTQIKGDSETHPILSPTDDFADYETWNGWAGTTMKGVKTDGWIERKRAEYARAGLKSGLSQQALLGVNPFKFGMIGRTDSHTSMSTADEDNFWGKFTCMGL